METAKLNSQVAYRRSADGISQSRLDGGTMHDETPEVKEMGYNERQLATWLAPEASISAAGPERGDGRA